MQPRDADEHYDRRQKNADEVYCVACGAIIKKDAEICPKCGVRNKLKVIKEMAKAQGGNPKGSVGWLIFWIIVFWPAAIAYYFMRRW